MIISDNTRKKVLENMNGNKDEGKQRKKKKAENVFDKVGIILLCNRL